MFPAPYTGWIQENNENKGSRMGHTQKLKKKKKKKKS
jgi:hypothetical protein